MAEGIAPLTVNFTGSVSGGSGGYSYSWNFGDGKTANSAAVSHTYQWSGAYTATLTVTDADEATDSDEVKITVYTLDTEPPLPPSNLDAATEGIKVHLNWSANTEPDLGGYNIYRGETSGGLYSKLKAKPLPE